MQENPRINQQDWQKITFPGSAYPKEISQQCTPTTHTEAVHCQRVHLGVSIPVSDHWRLLDSPLGEGCQTSRQVWRQYPLTGNKATYIKHIKLNIPTLKSKLCSLFCAWWKHRPCNLWPQLVWNFVVRFVPVSKFWHDLTDIDHTNSRKWFTSATQN